MSINSKEIRILLVLKETAGELPQKSSFLIYLRKILI
jgi:hypothetical protein